MTEKDTLVNFLKHTNNSAYWDMQNEKMRRIYAELEIARNRYFDLYDLAPVGYCTLSENGLILEANLTFASMLGLDRDTLAWQPISRYVLKEDRDFFFRHRKQLFEIGKSLSYELRMVNIEGTEIFAHIDETIAQDDASASSSRITISDMTEYMRMRNLLRERSEQFGNYFENAPDGIYLTDMAGNFIYGNCKAEEIIGYRREEIVGKNMQELTFLPPNELARLFILYQDAHRGDSLDVNEVSLFKKDGSTIIVSVNAKVVQHNGLPAVIGFFRDITHRKLIEIYVIMSRDILNILNEPKNFRDSIHHILALLKTQTGLDAVGIRLQDGESFPYYIQQGFPEDFLLAENTLIEHAVDGGPCQDKGGDARLECICGLVISGDIDPAHPLLTPGGSFYMNDSYPLLDVPIDKDSRIHPCHECIYQGYASVVLVPIRNRNGIVGLIQLNDRRKGCFSIETVEILEGIAANIGSAMERQQADDMLSSRNELYRLMTENIHDIVWTFDLPSMTFTFVSPSAQRILGYDDEAMLKNWDAIFSPETYQRIMESFANFIVDYVNGNILLMEAEHIQKDGNLLWMEISAIAIMDDIGNIVGLVGSSRDITERKRLEQVQQTIEKALRLSLSEKEVLLKEVHHRVKNNLAVIIGLVEIQNRTIADDASRSSRELTERIRSMALVHEQLYKSADFSKIDFHRYLNILTAHLRSSYQSSRNIQINVFAEGVQMDMGTAVPCGLLITELVTNSLKYAFPTDLLLETGGCEITVSAECDGADYMLSVSDNGVGLPPDLDWRNTQTMGLFLIRMLGQHQLQGAIEMDQTGGTTFRLRFKIIR